MSIFFLIVLPFSAALALPAESCTARAMFAPLGCEASALQGVDELIASGRKFLAEGKLDEALRDFSAAEKLDGATLKTRVFVLRTLIAQGQIEDALLEADALKSAGKSGVEVDYIFGMAFYAMAARDMASGQTTALTGSQFEDAVRYLKLVGAKNDARFEDAWSALADAAWYAQDMDAGQMASEKYVELAPGDPARRMLRGKLALAAYAQLAADETKAADADEQWQAAVEAFEKAIALCGLEPEPNLRLLAQQACAQLASAFLWKQMRDDAGAAYVRGIVLDPNTVDYNAIATAFPGQEFVDLMLRAHKSWSAKHDGSGAADATLQWWLGYAYYGAKLLPEAEKAFESALAKNPKFTNTLYYLFCVRFEKREYEQCLETLHKYAALDAPGLTASLAFDVARNSARLEGVIGWATDPKIHKSDPLNLEAAFACDLITKIVAHAPENSRHWNNLGLFLRDEGDRLRGTQGALTAAPKSYDEAKVNKLWEDSLAAYEVALELEPKNPNYLNDTAVMLHYYFLRDLERAKSMYAQGFQEATALLKRTDLSPDTRDAVQIALRDTGNNVKLVQKLIDKRAAEAAGHKDVTPPVKQ